MTMVASNKTALICCWSARAVAVAGAKVDVAVGVANAVAVAGTRVNAPHPARSAVSRTTIIC
ncbi:MAG: hypothetical protein WCF99_16650 [Chloroflexales bacterium]